MKKTLGLFAILTFVLLFAACGKENTNPVLSGYPNGETILLGDSFNVILGVHASDIEDGDLSSSVEFSISPSITVASDSSITPTEVGTYTITYTVTDSDGAVGTVDGTLEVAEVLFQLDASRSSFLLLTNGAYMDSNGVAGTWTYENFEFSLVTKTGDTYQGSFNAETNALEVVLPSGWRTTTYSADETTWQTALGTTGSYTAE